MTCTGINTIHNDEKITTYSLTLFDSSLWMAMMILWNLEKSGR